MAASPPSAWLGGCLSKEGQQQDAGRSAALRGEWAAPGILGPRALSCLVQEKCLWWGACELIVVTRTQLSREETLEMG